MWLAKKSPRYFQLILFTLLFPGVTVAAMSPRIVGGAAVVDPQERGFMAYLALFDGESFGSCGGALIKEDWVVTAAHCVDDRTPRTLRVIPGGQEVPDPREIVNNWREWSAVKRIVVHEDWDINTSQNDIALIQLEQPVNTGKTSIIDSASLNNEINSGAMAYAFGRGTQESRPLMSESDDPSTTRLFVVDLPLVAKDPCEDRLQAQYTDLKPDLEELAGGSLPQEDPQAKLSTGQLCAGGTTDPKDTCQGDSGGPIMAAKSNGLIYLAGVTSWGYGCAYYPTPGVYTRVPAYARAIDDVIKGRSTELKGVPDAGESAVLGDSGEQAGGGGGVFNGGWWVLLGMLRRRLRTGDSGNHG